MASLLEELTNLKHCFDNGVINDDEYSRLRSIVLEHYTEKFVKPKALLSPILNASKTQNILNNALFQKTEDIIGPNIPLETGSKDNTFAERLLDVENESLEELHNSTVNNLSLSFHIEDEHILESNDHIFSAYVTPTKVKNMSQFNKYITVSAERLSIGSPINRREISLNSEALQDEYAELIHTKINNSEIITNTSSLDLSVSLNQLEIPDMKTVYDLTEEEFWSLILGVYIPPGMYYPSPEDMIEQIRDPFPMAMELVNSIIDDNKADGIKDGAILLLRAYHKPVFEKLPIPWCISRTHRTKSNLYSKAEDLRIDFYCPWAGCLVHKRWYFIHPDMISKLLKNRRVVNEVNLVKHMLAKRYVEMNKKDPFPNNCYVIFEVLGNTKQHKHLKGSKGGSRIAVDESLKQFNEVTEHLSKKAGALNGNIMKLFAKSIAPCVAMAQCLANQPAEAFLAGFTDIVPHKLSCYQQDNTKGKRLFLENFGLKDATGDLNGDLSKIMQHFAATDAVHRKKLSEHINFNPTKCVIGYIQQLSFESNANWSCICFNESQLLSLICDLKVSSALLWDGTEPNTFRKNKTMMFSLLTQPGYGTAKRKKISEAPYKVIARLFSSDRTAAAQKHFFQVLIDKSKHYLNKPLDLTGVVLVTDMDPIINEVVETFGMKHYWNHRHVNQALVKHFKGHNNQQVVFKKFQEIRACETEEEARLKMKELEEIMLKKTISNSGEEVANPFYDESGWNYLQKVFLKDLNTLCHWTVNHLGSGWLWSQDVESRNNKDLNIWNAGANNLSVPEVIIRYSEIDKAEMHQAYLHYMSSNYSELEKSLSAQNKNSHKKFLTVLVRDYLESFSTEETEINEIKSKLFTVTNKRKKKHLSEDEIISEEEQSEITNKKVDEQSETMVQKATQLKELLQQKKMQAVSDEKVAKTVFNKPSKRRKRQQTIHEESQSESVMIGMIMENKVNDNIPLEDKKGKKSIAEWYLWSQQMLRNKTKDQIQQLAKKYNIEKPMSSSKKDLIPKLLIKRQQLLDQHASNVTSKQIDCKIENVID
jgi:hypothetical protein